MLDPRVSLTVNNHKTLPYDQLRFKIDVNIIMIISRIKDYKIKHKKNSKSISLT